MHSLISDPTASEAMVPPLLQEFILHPVALSPTMLPSAEHKYISQFSAFEEIRFPPGALHSTTVHVICLVVCWFKLNRNELISDEAASPRVEASSKFMRFSRFIWLAFADVNNFRREGLCRSAMV